MRYRLLQLDIKNWLFPQEGRVRSEKNLIVQGHADPILQYMVAIAGRVLQLRIYIAETPNQMLLRPRLCGYREVW